MLLRGKLGCMLLMLGGSCEGRAFHGTCSPGPQWLARRCLVSRALRSGFAGLLTYLGVPMS